MAQETRIAPIEFDRTPTQVMLNIAEQQQQDALKRQQVEFERAKYMRSLQDEEMKRRYENAQNFNSILQNSNWSKETRDMYLKQLLETGAKAKDIESFEFRTRLGQDIGKISQYDRMVKDVYAKADQYVNSLPAERKAGFSSEVFKNRFIQSALTKDGRFKTTEEMQADYDDNLAENVYQQNLKDLYDVSAGYKQMTDLIKSVPSSEISISKKDQKGKVISGTSQTVKFNPELQQYDEKAGVVKPRMDEFGYVTDDVYKKYSSFPAVNAFYTRKAEEFISNYNNSPKEAKLALMGQNRFLDKNGDGIPDALTELDIDLVKKGFMTQDIKREMPEYRKESESQRIIIGGTGTGKDKNDTTDFIQRVINESKNGTTQSLADLLYEMRAGNGKFEVTNVKVSKSNKGFVVDYNTGEFDEDGNPIMGKRSFNPFDKNFAIDLANFYQRATGSDAKLEKNILQGKKDYKANSPLYLIGGKEYSMDALTKMGYTSDQISQAVKLGTVKTK
jgi:hypothetical protein